MQPKFIIHGGLGSKPKSPVREVETRKALQEIADKTASYITHHTALDTVIYAVSMLEDHPLFNAGTGSKLQRDGMIRMTASVMDGTRQRFAGVINITYVKNPIQVAARLLEKDDRVLSGSEAGEFARMQGFPAYNPEIPERRRDFENRQAQKSGTVGCVALDTQGNLAAATSTGGKGFEIPGRVSDSATVAGNYANSHAAISCTGIGEDIVDGALAARIVTRVTDGLTLVESCTRSIAEMKAQHRHAGIIALAADGAMFQDATEPYLAYAIYDGKTILFKQAS